MSHLEQFIGMELTPYQFEIEKGKIKEFAMAIGDDNPIYYSLDDALACGFEGIPIPFTFLQVIDSFGGNGAKEVRERMQLNWLRILHGEQEYEYVKDVYAGDTLTATGKVEDVITKQGSSGIMDLIKIEHRYKNQKDELVAIARRVFIQRR